MTIIGHLDLVLMFLFGVVFAGMGFSWWFGAEDTPSIVLSFVFAAVLIGLPILAWTGVI